VQKEEHIETPQQLDPVGPAPKKKKGAVWIWLIAIVIVIAVINAGKDPAKPPVVTGTDATAPTSQPAAALPTAAANTFHGKITIVETKWVTGEYGVCEIVGIAQNVSRAELTYAQIEINLLDASGATVGSTLANINNLAAGATWKFKAPVLEESATKFEIKDVTAM